MDVTSLLNAGTNPLNRRDSLELTPTPSIDGSTVASTAVPTPSPEKSPIRRLSDPRAPRNRTPWDAGGYSLPLTLDTKFVATSAKPAFYAESPTDNMNSATSYNPSSENSHSRQGSLGSSPIEMANSTGVTAINTSHQSR
jgi:hypothetical protein